MDSYSKGKAYREQSRQYSYCFLYFAYFRRNRSMRPAVSTSFCLPVKKGWHFEHISTRISVLVEPTSISLPQAHRIDVSAYCGWMLFFIIFQSLMRSSNSRILCCLSSRSFSQVKTPYCQLYSRKSRVFLVSRHDSGCLRSTAVLLYECRIV